MAGERPRIIDDPPLIYHYADTRDAEFLALAALAIADYKESLSPERHVLIDRYKLVDAAFNVVGVGSVGTFCGVTLSISGNGDPLFMQFKEARRSVLEPYAGNNPYLHHGQRVVAEQRLMQAASDPFLGWMSAGGLWREHTHVRAMRSCFRVTWAKAKTSRMP